jgi:ribosomal protein L11 methyltransferase
LHPTTRLALIGLEKWSAAGHFKALPSDGPGVLDVGTGSGILLLAAIALGASHGTGVDIDPLSVAAASENAARNGVAERVTNQAGSLPISAPAPLVMANLVASLHIELAPLLVGAMAPGGRLLTSGMFISRADEAIAALQAAGATLVDRWEEGEWVAAEFRDGRATLAS